MKAAIHLESISKNYGAITALADIVLSVPGGEIMAVLGPSGSGKSTLLNIVAGVTDPTHGRVFVEGEDITRLPIENRDIGVVFQSYGLFPHLTAFDNVLFPLRTRRHKIPDAEARARVIEMIEMVGLRGCEASKPRQLSGGQQQRVALARALVFQPRLLLLDEPLAALDASLRETVQQDIVRIQSHLGISVLYVTHDQREAMSIAHGMTILRDGRIQQIGTPQSIYDEPGNVFVASFLGEVNTLSGTVRHVTQGTCVLETPTGQLQAPHRQSVQEGTMAALLVRPEAIRLTNGGMPLDGVNCAFGQVSEVAFLGNSLRLKVRVTDDVVWTVYRPRNDSPEGKNVGDRVTLVWDVAQSQVMPGQHGPAQNDKGQTTSFLPANTQGAHV